MMRQIPFFLHSTLFLCFLFPSWSWAWSYQVPDQIKPGKRAVLKLSPPETLKKVLVSLQSSNQTIDKKFRVMKAGKTYKIAFKPPKGSSTWKASVSGRVGEETLTAEFEFTLISARPLKVQFLDQKSSLKKGELYFKSNNQLNQASLVAHGDQGEVLWEDEIKFIKKNGSYLARFQPRPDLPRRLEIKTTDEYGSWLSVRVVRWYAEVPHEDILFASGSAEITANEEPKMIKALQAVKDELAKFRKAMGNPDIQIDLRLYVGGYTDTVGSKKDNRRLSEKRARSIAAYFKKQHLPIQILYAGFGEDALLVKTADQTEESRNRRAVYVVANQIPNGPFFPRASWKKP